MTLSSSVCAKNLFKTIDRTEDDPVRNISGGSGVSMPPYYLPTPSVKNKSNYFPQIEPLGSDEMRIIFMGSNPWPPRLTQASTCIMVELGGSKRLFFDFGPGCTRNIIANQVPVPEINDIFVNCSITTKGP